jgi:hypothetical protein
MYSNCEYQIYWTDNEWFISGFVLASQIQVHVYVRAGWNFWVHQSIKVCIIYQSCEYQLIWAFNEWLIGGLVLANKIQLHAHAPSLVNFGHVDLLSVLISNYDINIKQIQGRTLKYIEIYQKYITFARAYVHACSGPLFSWGS